MPRLWNETIDEHRRSVRQAIMDTTATLATEHGLASVTMSGIAEQTGIGRATLYKYFPDVESILVAWHEVQVEHHLGHLKAIGEADGAPVERLKAVLTAFAAIPREHHGTELAELLHAGDRAPHVGAAQRQLTGYVADLIAAGAEAGEIRNDVAAGELAAFCLHALTASHATTSKAATRRLIAVTLDALGPEALRR